MPYPLQNWITAPRGYKFGDQTFYANFHIGLDVVVLEGTNLIAPFDCLATSALTGRQGGYGIQAEWRDERCGLIIMRCLHLQKLPVIGQFKAGDVIGQTGNTGAYSRAPHLHVDLSQGRFNARDRKNFIDPEEYFRQAFGGPGLAARIASEKFYRQAGQQRIFALVGGKLIPMAVALKDFQSEFAGSEVARLEPAEFAHLEISQKFKIVSS